MWFKRMPLEDWFDTYQYDVEFDIGESAVKYLRFGDLNLNLNTLPLRYGYHKGRPDLRAVIAGQYAGLNSENIIVTTGASEANFAVVSALVKPDDHVIIEHPTYPSLYEVPRSLGCDVTLFPLKYEDRFQLDVDGLLKQIRRNTKLITLTHPNNPTGAMLPESDLKRIVQAAEHYGVYLMVDETYSELAFEKKLPLAATLSNRVISISSMSKCYGLPGIRIGWLATQSDEILKTVLAVREQVTIANCAVSEEIAFNVLKNKDDFLSKAKTHIWNNLKMVSDWINLRNDIGWVPPEAGVVALPRIIAPGVTEYEAIYRALMDTYKTFVIPGRCFELDNSFFRLGFGGTSDELKVGLQNFNLILNEFKKK